MSLYSVIASKAKQSICFFVIPAEAGISFLKWIPACAGMTKKWIAASGFALLAMTGEK
jgi:hypothetical protein